ncbi:MAG: hypothetical protein KME06_01195 [Kastovskya adunca ATA6-11-RM4]|jgi:signal transduction histidine kinase|nr:hypothetical protein [Kastovskya adunca ATA6-11-RM4]
MSYPGTILTTSSDIRLIVLAILVAVIGSYTSLDIAEQITLAKTQTRYWWLTGSALTLGITIWVTHFTAMLAHRLPVLVGYDHLLIFLAMVIAVVGSGFGIFVVSREPEPSTLTLSVGSTLIGIGIMGMHYIGMAAMRAAVYQSYDPKLVILSGVVVVSASFVTLRITFGRNFQSRIQESVRKLGSALLMGTAISGLHGIAMAAVTFHAAPPMMSNFSVIDHSFLAVTIGIGALLMLIVALIASFFGRRLSAELAKTEALRQSEERLEQLVKQRTQELEAEKILSDAANRAKTEFLANMSHELRTPLTAIIGFSSVLLEEKLGLLNDKQRLYVAESHKCGHQLLELINDLLDLSKIEAEREELILENCSVQEVCQGCLSLVYEQAQRRGLQLSLSIEPTLKSCIADRRRLKQILLNLLSNAIKFTESGLITLDVLNGSDCMQFQVTDTGIGIAEAEQAKVFQTFQQLDSGLNRQYEGTGLGLALAQKLAKLHGGDILLKSELGSGSSFTLVLPVCLEDRSTGEQPE